MSRKDLHRSQSYSPGLRRTESFARDASFTKSVTHMQSFRQMKMHKRMDQPGPGDYQVAGLPMPSGGRFNMSNPKSNIDWQIYRAKHIPGPADYPAPQLSGPGGGRFSTANPKTQLDWVEYFAAQIPGPSDYGAPKLPKPGGGRFSTANPKTQIEWIQYFGKQLPGCADYNPKTKALSRYKSSPAFSCYGTMVKGNHQTQLENAIMYEHTTVNQKGPNQCRRTGAVGKQPDSQKRTQPAFSFGRSGTVPPQMNRRDVQRAAGLTEHVSRMDEYSKYFGYHPKKMAKNRVAGKRVTTTVSKRRGRRKNGGSRTPHAQRPYTASDAYSPIHPSSAGHRRGASSGGGAGAGVGSAASEGGSPQPAGFGQGGGFGGGADPDPEGDLRSPSTTKGGGTRRRRRRPRRRKGKKGSKKAATEAQRVEAMRKVIPAVLSVGRPVFGAPDTPAPGAYDPEPSTLGATFNSRFHSSPSFSFLASTTD